MNLADLSLYYGHMPCCWYCGGPVHFFFLHVQLLSLKVLITAAADDILIFSFIFFFPEKNKA